MSDQPPHDGSQSPIHEQPTQGVPHVEDQGQGTGQDRGDDRSGGSTDWSAPPPASPYGGGSGSSYGQAPQYGESAPPPSYGNAPAYGQAPQYGESAPRYGSAPAYGQSAPYGRTEKDPYAQGQQGGYDGSNGYGQGQQGGYGGYDGYGQQPGYYAAQPQQGAGTNVSAIVLTVLAGLTTLSCYFSLAGVPALVFAIIALTKQNSDMAASRRMTKIGWIVWGVLMVVVVIAIVVIIAVVVSHGSSSDPSTYGASYDSTF